MPSLVLFAVSLVLGSVILKGAIRLVDGFNYKNSWSAAAGWTLVFALASVPTPFPFSILLLVAWLAVLNRYYEIDALRCVGVVVAQVVLSLAVGFGLGAVVGALA